MANWLRSRRNTSKPAKLIRIEGGGVERIKMRKKVAEVMIDNPNQFVCEMGSLKAGHRISAVAAEEEIEMGKTYLLLPFHKLRSVMSEREMGRIDELKNKSFKSNSKSNSKVVAVSEDGFEGEKSLLPKLEVNEDGIEALKMRIGRQTNWKPSLHTIHETPTLKFQVLSFRSVQRH